MEIIFKEESYEIMGACFEVNRECGAGFVEPIYQECMGIELGLRGIPLAPKVQLPLHYKDRPLESKYIPDFFCYN
jgi:GxxExxY protein